MRSALLSSNDSTSPLLLTPGLFSACFAFCLASARSFIAASYSSGVNAFCLALTRSALFSSNDIAEPSDLLPTSGLPKPNTLAILAKSGELAKFDMDCMMPPTMLTARRANS